MKENVSARLQLSAEIVVAYIGNNPIKPTELPQLITDVYAAFSGLNSEPEYVGGELPAQKPAVPIRKSITPDFLVCLEDGRRFKSLRRHLASLGMTPEGYREKWKLPPDYPMVAPNYSTTRSALAKSFGLGRKLVADRESAAPLKKPRRPL